MKGFLFFACIIISLNFFGQNPVGNIYGTYWTGSHECLATINQQNGSVNTIDTIPNMNFISTTGGSATFDGDSSRYIVTGGDFTGHSRLYTIDACNAQVIYNPIMTAGDYAEFGYLHYSSTTKKIYAMALLDSTFRVGQFGTLNQYTGKFNPIMNTSGQYRFLYSGNPCSFMPDSNLFIALAQDSVWQTRIYTIDVLTGSLKYPAPPISIQPNDLEYDTITKTIYGIYHNGSTEEYISINRYNGSFNIIQSIPGFQYAISFNGGQDTNIFNTSVFNTDSNQYVAVSTIAPGATTDIIYSLNPSTGNVIYKPSIPNFINLSNFTYGHGRAPYFKPSFSPNPNAVCPGTSVTLSASGGKSYLWGNGLTDSTIIVAPKSTTTYSISVFNRGCEVIDSIMVIVNPISTATITGNNSICKGDSTILSVSGGGANDFSWNNGSTNSSIQISPDSTTFYSVVISNGVCQDTVSKNIVVNALPVVSFLGNKSICLGQSTTLSASGGGLYNWNTGDTTTSIIIHPKLSSTYSVTVTDVNGCTVRSTQYVTVNPNPIVSVSGGGAIMEGKSMQLTATSGMLSYFWTPDNGLSCSNCFNPIATPDVNTNFCVYVVDSNNCSGEICTEIDITCGEVFVPSAFSPNGDNQNDVLYVRGKCIQSFNFLVFDRWGEKVFESENLAYGWDGKLNGQPCSAGAYTFYMKGTMFDGSNVTKMGSVILVR